MNTAEAITWAEAEGAATNSVEAGGAVAKQAAKASVIMATQAFKKRICEVKV